MKGEYSSSQLQHDSTENAFYLKTQVPLTRELNELIRSKEEVELLRESKIISVKFNNYDRTTEDARLLPETSEENTETETHSEDVLTDETSEEPPVSPVAEASLPEKLKLITFNISILTKTTIN